MSITQSKLGVTISNPTESTDCCCSVKISQYYEGEVSYLILFKEDCAGFNNGVWQEFDHFAEIGEWADLPDTGITILQEINKSYRYKITKEGCCDTYSNLVPVFYFSEP